VLGSKIEEYAREGLRMVAAAWKPAAAGQTELTQQSDSGLQPLGSPVLGSKIEEYAREGLRMVAAAWKPAAAGQTELT
ncbi:hypothetical protein CQA61_30070, partial [Klebsiella pneumoniae]